MKSIKKLMLLIPLMLLAPTLMSNSPAPHPFPNDYADYTFSTTRIEAIEEKDNTRIEVDLSLVNNGTSYISLSDSTVTINILNGINISKKNDFYRSIYDYSNRVEEYAKRNEVLFPGETLITTLNYEIYSSTMYGDISNYITVESDIRAYSDETIVSVTKEITNTRISVGDDDRYNFLFIDEVVTTPKDAGVGLTYVRVKIDNKWYGEIQYTRVRKNSTDTCHYSIYIPTNMQDVDDITEIETIHFILNDYYNHNHFNIYLFLMALILTIILVVVIVIVVTIILVVRHNKKKKLARNNDSQQNE